MEESGEASKSAWKRFSGHTEVIVGIGGASVCIRISVVFSEILPHVSENRGVKAIRTHLRILILSWKMFGTLWEDDIEFERSHTLMNKNDYTMKSRCSQK